MSQGPISTQAFALNPSNVTKPLKVDTNGNLLVSQTGGVKSAGLKYVTAAASTTQACGTGAVGDTLNTLVIVPGTSAAGVVQIKDGTGGGAVTITVFAGGGTTALSDLKPLVVQLNAVSAVGGWSVITNANVTAIAVGQFTA